MKLKEAHRDELWSIGKRGLATIIAVLLFWGTTAPTAFHLDDIDLIARYSGVCVTIVIIGCFRSAYHNLLTTNITTKDRQMGFVLFWFVGSIFFDVGWQLPLWTIPAIRNAPKTMDGLWWKICWWSYTLHDTNYETATPLVVVSEIWWLLIRNLFGGVGLVKIKKYYAYDSSSTSSDQYTRTRTQNEALLLFCVCGALQCSSALFYLFLSYFFSHFNNVPTHVSSQAVFWGLNGFWASASALAATFSSLLLLSNKSKDSL
jgi:hypothetical protein